MWREVLKKDSIKRTAVVSSQPLTAETIISKQIKPGDYVTPDQTFQDQYKRVLFTQGKEYTVLGYPTHALGLNVQSDEGPWTITFNKELSIGNHFSWKKPTPPTPEERSENLLETTPYTIDIVQAVADLDIPFSQKNQKELNQLILQRHVAEVGEKPQEFKEQMSVAWGLAFHLGFIATIPGTDKVSITQAGREFLQS